MLVDPSNHVLAYSTFPNKPGNYAVNGHLKMPVIWTRQWGKGRVFYSSLGHQVNVVEAEPHLTIMRRGFRWAVTGKV
jgi:type 1 glutamine amidotransferase